MNPSVVVELSEGAPLRVLSLWQPWASLVAAGAKRWETRSWRPREIGGCRPRDYRGLLAIHAARTTYHPPFMPRLEAVMARANLPLVDDLPRGSIVALVRILRIVKTEEIRDSPKIDADERAVGDWSDGRFGWELELLGVPTVPIPFRASQGCREAPRELAAQLVADLEPPPAPLAGSFRLIRE